MADGWDLRYITSEGRSRVHSHADEGAEEPFEAFAQDLPCAPRQQPPFAWKAASEFEREFEISGADHDVATKLGDFKDPQWVVPVGGTLRLLKGGIYRWSLRLERICHHRPQMQIGVHGANHRRPWRLMTTTRCSRAKDEDPWQERPGPGPQKRRDAGVEVVGVSEGETELVALHWKRGRRERPMDREDTMTAMENHAWIDTEKKLGQGESCWDRIDELLQSHIKVIVSLDGSEQSSCAFEWALHGFAQSDRETELFLIHYYDNSKEYLPPKWRKNAIQADAEAKCTSYLVSKRYTISIRERDQGKKIGELLCQDIRKLEASFCIMGFVGRKGKDKHIIGSNVLEVMQRGKCSCVVFKESDPGKLTTKRPAKFVVSTGLNPAATKAFVDALRLSRPGDEIHVVYIRPFLEPPSKESKVTQAIRNKYDAIFEGMKDASAWPSGKMVKFADRNVKLVFAPQGIHEGIAQALVRYAQNFEADFVLVGTNVLRGERGKAPVGSVSLQIVMQFPGNCVVSSFNPDTDQCFAHPHVATQCLAPLHGKSLQLDSTEPYGHGTHRLGGDRMLAEGDYIHVEVVFDDIALTSGSPLMPVVCMGGDGSRVRLCPAS
ncbi:unnamed protein product [Effrenium voratum]|nr:unnamed protein product [Effrenium voratum]